MAASDPPRAVLENRFAVPPSFAASWLTDFRPDDGQRWFDFRETAQVSRTPEGFHIETPFPWGRGVTDISLESPTHWTSKGQMINKRGKVMALTKLDESVTPEGTGTVHRIQMWLEPQGTGAKLMFAFAGGSMLRGLRRGFAKMKVAMEQEYAQGPRPP